MSEIEQRNPDILEQAIIAEGTRLLNEESDKWPGFLNNFYTNVLPEENSRWRTRRQTAKDIGWWGKKNRETTDSIEGHSDVWLNQTPEEYFQTIDQVISKLDTDGAIRLSINRYCNATNYSESAKAQDELERRLIPVFARLVARIGYTRYELTG